MDTIALNLDGITPDLDRPALIKAARHAYDTAFVALKDSFETDHPGEGFLAAQKHAALVDTLLIHLYDLVCEQEGFEPEGLCVAAVGGYGRRQMAPYSDVDLLFLRPNTSQQQDQDKIVTAFLYLLWDLKFKVGPATRTVAECISLAKTDTTICTALLEARFLKGHQETFERFKSRYQSQIQGRLKDKFLRDKLEERDNRHEHHGGSRYALEPHIKEAKGGLRDIHTLFWITHFLYEDQSLDDLQARGMFSQSQKIQFEKAQNFLWAVRFHLHFFTRRAEERLTFDLQPEIAQRLGYHHRVGVRAVERFMKHVFHTAKTVGNLSHIVLASVHADNPSTSWFQFRLPRYLRREKTVDGFVLENDQICVLDAKQFQDNPLDLLRLFEVAQKHRLEVHPTSLRLVTQNLKQIDNDLRQDPAANALFLDILTSRKDPAKSLRMMNETGVLGRFLPEWGHIVGLMQFNRYHHYTVDEHTLFAIDNLWRIEQGRVVNEQPLSTTLITKITSRRALYVAVLLHDIAKGKDRPHEVVGSEMAEKICPRLGLSDWETALVAWLIRQHLEASKTMQHRDLDDPQTIEDFSALVGSLERLRCLHILTAADIRAVGPGVWNGWKAAMLRRLYLLTEDHLRGGVITDGRQARIAASIAAFRGEMAEWPVEKIDSFILRCYPHYWLSYPVPTLATQARMMDQADSQNKPLDFSIRPSTKKGSLELIVYLNDHPGALSRLTGAVALAGGTIEDLHAHVFRDDRLLDIFTVRPSLDSPEDHEIFERLLNHHIPLVMQGEVRLGEELTKRHYRPSGRREIFQIEPQVIVDNEASKSHTVVEVIGNDEIGILSRMTYCFYQLNLTIHIVKATTYGTQFVDVFYVQDVTSGKVLGTDKLQRIRKALLATLKETAQLSAA